MADPDGRPSASSVLLARLILDAVEGRRRNPLGYDETNAALAREVIADAALVGSIAP